MAYYLKLQFILILLFSVTQTEGQAPSNNEPSNAGILTISPACNWVAGTTVNATSTHMLPWGYTGPTCADASCSGGVTAFPNDVFYKFNSLSNTDAVIQIDAPDQIGTIGLLRVFASTNGVSGFSMHACACSGSASLNIGSMSLTGLSPNTVYYIAASPKVGTSGFWTPFDICLTKQVVLPVSLISFSASYISNKISLKWESESEINFEGYSIEKSYDLKSFEEVVFIPSKEFMNKSNQYEYSYQEYNQQNMYYRLKMIDKDGSYNYSDIQSVKMNLRGITFSPNPAKDYIFVDFLENKQEVKFELLNTFGQIVLQGILSNTIDLSNVDSGTYFLRTQYGKCHKIIVL